MEKNIITTTVPVSLTGAISAIVFCSRRGMYDGAEIRINGEDFILIPKRAILDVNAQVA